MVNLFPMFSNWKLAFLIEVHTLLTKKDIPMPQLFHMGTVCADLRTRAHTSCIHHGILFLNQVEPCQRVVSTSWCTSDGVGCDVGSANGCSQDAPGSHTMGTLNHPVRHTDRKEHPACQLVEQRASPLQRDMRCYVVWKTRGHNHRESSDGLRSRMTRIVKNDAGARFQRISLQ